MQSPNNDTFCVAPWFQVRNQNDMQKRVCCAISTYGGTDSENSSPIDFLNSDKNIELKKKLHNGIKVKECSKCWRNEKNNITSLRQRLNGVLLHNKSDVKNTWLQSYFNRKKDFTSDDLLMADVKVGNTCNHACVMCSPDDSSMVYNEWIKNKNVFFIKDKLKDDPDFLKKVALTGYKNQSYRKYIDDICKNKNLKFIKILGGEPLLDRYLLTKLKDLPKKQKNIMSLHIVTNGSVNLLETKEYLGDFKNIKFNISLEGIGDVQEYARYHSKWAQLEKNILDFKQSQYSDISIHHTLQTTTVLGLSDLLQWINSNDLSISFGMCLNPKYLSFMSLPGKVRHLIQKIFTNDVPVKQNDIGDEEPVTTENILNYIDEMKFNKDEYQKFLKYIKWYEKNKSIKPLKDIFPILFDN